jgi:hypothetical protein
MKIRTLSLLLFCCIAAACCNAQTVNDLISKHIDAVGGKEKLASIKTIYTEGEVMIADNPLGTGKSKTYQVAGKNLREEMTFGTYLLIENYSAKGSWSVNPFLNKMKPGPMDEEPANAGVARIGIETPLIDYATTGSSVQLIGKENINGTNAHKLKLVTKDGTEFIYLIDPTTFYILKRSIRSKTGQEIKEEIFSDYKKTEPGIVIPFASEFKVGQSATMYLVLNKVDFNKDIDPSLFEMPK